MSPTGDSFFALPEMGGLAHPPQTIPSHLQLGAASESLLQRTLTMAVTVTTSDITTGGEVRATVTLTNTGAGHHVPTDFPGRHLILLVEAFDGDGQPLTLRDGPFIPEWGGEYAGQPGRAYAKVLEDLAEGDSPVVSYWKQTKIVSDNRIPALGSDTAQFRFSDCNECDHVQVRATVLLRRTFAEIAAAKGWAMPDMLLAKVTNDGVMMLQSEVLLYLPMVD
jgi:hypothetical protein